MSNEPTCWDILLEQFLQCFYESEPDYLAESRPNEEFAENFAWELYGFPGGGGIKGHEILKYYLRKRADRLRELQDRGNVSMDEVLDLLAEFPLAEQLQSRVFEPPPKRKQLSTEEYWKWRASVDNED
jgi:hypothetical protein